MALTTTKRAGLWGTAYFCIYFFLFIKYYLYLVSVGLWAAKDWAIRGYCAERGWRRQREWRLGGGEEVAIFFAWGWRCCVEAEGMWVATLRRQLGKASVYFEISKSPNLQNGEMEIWRNASPADIASLLSGTLLSVGRKCKYCGKYGLVSRLAGYLTLFLRGVGAAVLTLRVCWGVTRRRQLGKANVFFKKYPNIRIG